MAPLFDAIVIVDWSAANTPKSGKDSIWIGEARRTGNKIKSLSPINMPTRSDAMDSIEKRIAKTRLKGERIFIGFDFPFGYPAGASSKLTGHDRWDALWNFFAEHINDNEKNQSNRYDFAAALNREKLAEPVYWGRPYQRDIPDVPIKKSKSPWRNDHEFRHVEKRQRPAKSVWQLAYNGAVGSQAILGMARLQKMRSTLGAHGLVWPFETRWDQSLSAPVIIAEVYPSMLPVTLRKDDVKDAAQVRTMAKHFATLDAKGAFKTLLSKPSGLSEVENEQVLCEEGWIVGSGHAIR